MNKKLLLFFICIGSAYAQNDSGFVYFGGDESWRVEISDSLTIQSGLLTKLPTGKYKFIARPQISYSWPAVIIEKTIEIQQADTLLFFLSVQNSTTQPLPIPMQPKITSYSENGYQPSIRKHPKLKTGLILSAIAANWLSFYLKRQADDYYKDYRSASNLSKINNFYDKSRKFDTYSNIMLGVSAAALSSYIYLSLKD